MCFYIVTEDGEKHLVELKCPYAAREMTIEEALSNVKSFCLSRENNEHTLKQNHKHFYQVQVQLHVRKNDKMLLCCMDPERLRFSIYLW